MFYVQNILLALTLIAMYVCLKWYNFPFISRKEAEITAPAEHQQWVKMQNIIRFFILIAAIIINACEYFLMDYVGGGYLAIMALLCLPFVFTKRQK